MMKTALSIIQSVCRRINHPVPTTLLSLTDPDELQLLELLYAVCEELRQARCWVQLKRKHAFTTVNGQASYQLPADFYAALMPRWNTAEDLRLIGPVSDDDFGAKLYGSDPSSFNFTLRLFGRDENTASASGQVELSPTPSSAVACAFEYITRSYLLPQNWAASTSYGANAYVNASGNIYQKGAGTATSGATVPSHTSGSVSDGTIAWTYISTPYETVLADTDLVVFDDDLVKLGLEAYIAERRGGDYEALRGEFQAKIDQAVGRYRGPYLGSFCAPKDQRAYTVTPLKGWSL